MRNIIPFVLLITLIILTACTKVQKEEFQFEVTEVSIECRNYVAITDKITLEGLGYTVEDGIARMDNDKFIIGEKKFCMDEDISLRCSDICYIETKVRNSKPNFDFMYEMIVCFCPVGVGK